MTQDASTQHETQTRTEPEGEMHERERELEIHRWKLVRTFSYIILTKLQTLTVTPTLKLPFFTIHLHAMMAYLWRTCDSNACLIRSTAAENYVRTSSVEGGKRKPVQIQECFCSRWGDFARLHHPEVEKATPKLSLSSALYGGHNAIALSYYG